MIKVEYTLVKWEKGNFRGLPITIQQEALEDFCEMMGWNKEEFANNTIRRPIVCEDEEEERLKNSVQKIKPIIVDIDDPKQIKKLKKDFKKEKRKRRTKAEMEEAKGIVKKNNAKRYPDEMKEFIERHMNQNSNIQLSNLINEKWDVEITPIRLNSYMNYNKIKRINPTQFRDYNNKKKSGKIGSPTKYTKEIVDFLRENVNNFSNKELCRELESKFNLKVKVEGISQVLCNKGIKREKILSTGMDKKIVDFILKSKINDVYYLRDQIIEKFEQDIPTRKLRDVMDQRTELPGESVKDEIKRIKEKREELDEDIDEMGLD